ncbi:MAG: type II toxin-antitoxin system HicB family antitoxin [Bacteroidetes bacterium]|nr:MAG: type II toxin-antitoxin system HicB family antitoxin [Bacteroidota bacterium]
MRGKLTVIIEKDEYGYYVYCPELKGCHTQGETFEEAVTNIKEAVELYLETIDPDKDSIILNKDIYSTSIEVAIA